MEEKPQKKYRVQFTARLLHGKDPVDKTEREVDFHDETRAKLWVARMVKMMEMAQHTEEHDGEGQTDEGSATPGD